MQKRARMKVPAGGDGDGEWDAGFGRAKKVETPTVEDAEGPKEGEA